MSAAAAFAPKPVIGWTRRPRLEFPRRGPKGKITPYARDVWDDINEKSPDRARNQRAGDHPAHRIL